jgi:(p)ppGpp synthase/HD superfamily hydrolase
MSTLENAIALAAAAHAGQLEKNGTPYILHPLRVMMSVGGAGPGAQIAAVLHDVVEDTSITLEDLRAAGFSAEILEAIATLTHDKSTDYFTYIRAAAANEIARAVKRADLRDNMDLSRIPEPQEKDHVRIARYHDALSILNETVA